MRINHRSPFSNTPQNPMGRRNFLAILSAASGSAFIASPVFGKLIETSDSGTLAAQPILSWDTIHKAGLHVMADQSTGGNALVMTTATQTLLVDTKFAHLGGALVEDAKAFAGEQDQFELTLINTHHHGDHTGGNGMVVPFAIASYAHENALPRIESQLDRYKQGASNGPAQVGRSRGAKPLLEQAINAASAGEAWTKDDVVPKAAVQDHHAIDLDGTTVDMHHFGAGHTDNDLVVHIKEHDIIHTGDLVFAGLHPYMDASAGVTARGWVESLESILKLCDQSTIVIPGHGPVGTKKTVQSQLDYLNELIEHVQRDIDAGVSKADCAEKSWDFMDGLGFESVRSRAIETTYDELAD